MKVVCVNKFHHKCSKRKGKGGGNVFFNNIKNCSFGRGELPKEET